MKNQKNNPFFVFTKKIFRLYLCQKKSLEKKLPEKKLLEKTTRKKTIGKKLPGKKTTKKSLFCFFCLFYFFCLFCLFCLFYFARKHWPAKALWGVGWSQGCKAHAAGRCPLAAWLAALLDWP